jgi:hypothetical protein
MPEMGMVQEFLAGACVDAAVFALVATRCPESLSR